MSRQILFLHPDAPAKPAPGAPCTGCGVCCAAEPCPAGRLLFRQRHGRCPALRWENPRYACVLVSHPEVHFRRLPRRLHGLIARLFSRWIAAGSGCDSQVNVVPMPALRSSGESATNGDAESVGDATDPPRS